MDKPEHPFLAFKNVPGRVAVQIVDFQDGDPQHQLKDGQGNRGISMSQLRKKFGGDEGEITDPHRGELHHISLKPWLDKDPEKTFLKISFRFIPDDPDFRVEPPKAH